MTLAYAIRNSDLDERNSGDIEKSSQLYARNPDADMSTTGQRAKRPQDHSEVIPP